MIVNPDCIFLIGDKSLILWNLKDHEQFELTDSYLSRAIELVEDISKLDTNNPIDQELMLNNFLINDISPLPEWGWDELSRIFHLGTKNIPITQIPEDESEWSELYLQHCHEALHIPFPSGERLVTTDNRTQLSRPDQKTNFSDTLTSRATSRQFEESPISLSELSEILFYTLGYLPERSLPTEAGLPVELGRRRCSPSGGGLNSVEGYVYARDIDGLIPGVYYYNPTGHSLHLLSEGFSKSFGSLLSGQHFSNNLPFGIFLTSRLDKLWWKYKHSRTYRMALIEVGHVAQTFQLTATNIGLNTWLTGAFQDSDVEELLRIENPAEQVLFFVGAGHGKNDRTPEVLSRLIDRQIKNHEDKQNKNSHYRDI